MKNQRRVHALRIILALIAVALLASCLAGPQTMPFDAGIAVIPAIVSAPPPQRGTVIDAIPLPMESATSYLGILKPELLGMRINVKPLVEAGFFLKIESIKSVMKPVRQIRLRYWSEDANGRPIKLSGMLYLPAATGEAQMPVPLLLICHGTQVLRDRVPSRLQGGERPIAILAAATGYAVAMPDYPGLGDGEGFHPYCHAQSLAHAGVDILRAARAFLRLPQPALLYVEASRLFIGGYSEGGYAAMATARELELSGTEEFALQGVFPFAGPFDMSHVMRDLMMDDQPIPQPYYMPFTILGWAPWYPGFVPSALLRQDVLDAIMPVFDGRNPSKTINDAIARFQNVPPGKAIASKMLTAEAKAALMEPEASALGRAVGQALRDNDLADWQADTKVPMHFMAVRKDELVPIENSLEAFEAMKARGVPVDFRVLDQTTHENGAYEAYGIMLLSLWKSMGL
jgi:pimeloyl-ACP methyl ester carboxylesterase